MSIRLPAASTQPPKTPDWRKLSAAKALAAQGKARAWAAALALWADLPAQGHEPDGITCSAALTVCKPGGWARILSLLEAAYEAGLRPDAGAHNAALSTLARSGLWVDAVEFLAAACKRDVVPDVITYSAAVSACEKGEMWRQALGILAEARSIRVLPNVITYNSAISACSRCGKWDWALALLDEMAAYKLSPDTISYSAAINACAARWEYAVFLVSAAANSNVGIDTIMCNSAITACEKGGQWQRALAVLRMARQAIVPSDVITCSALVSACAAGAQWELALSILHEMRIKGPPPNEFTCSAAVSACAAAGRWDVAVRILRDIGGAGGLRPNTVAYGSALGSLAAVAHWERASIMLGQAQGAGVDFDAPTLSAASTACCKGGAWRQALVRARQAHDISLGNAAAVNAAVGAAAGAGWWAGGLTILREAASQADAECHNTAMFGCLRASAWRECLQLLNASDMRRIAPDNVAYRWAARACGFASLWRRAVGILLSSSALSDDAGDVENNAMWSAATWACEMAGVDPLTPEVALGRSLRELAPKEASLLDFVRQHAPLGDLDGVLSAVESFASERHWLKIEGGAKRHLLESCIRPGDRIVELGAYVGYSSLVLTRRLRQLGGGGRMLSCEISPTSGTITRAVQEHAGLLSGEACVKVGSSSDWLASGALGGIDMLVLDHRGTIYHEDLRIAEHMGLTMGARVLADNVLSPGAPLFLAHIAVAGYQAAVHEMTEYLQPEIQDWVVVCAPERKIGLQLRRFRRLSRMQASSPEMHRWSLQIDEISWRSMHGPVDWLAFQSRMLPSLRAWRALHMV